MSHAPRSSSVESNQDQVAAFLQANTRREELLRNGVSFSGQERNCCFLNTGAQRFANISAAAGLDHIGDGRAYALSDWDQDGDLDLWATNRTAPRVQFLQNNSELKNNFLAVRLQGAGKYTNRDAIGARVELVLRKPKSATRRLKSVKTLHGGEGFLSQSSKWLHFGLGSDRDVDSLVVRWPGGDAETFTGLEANRRYILVQGTGKAQLWTRPTGDVRLAASSNEKPEPSEPGRIQLRFRIPMPPLDYETIEGRKRSLDYRGGSPTLVNLWASWCQPCLRELADFRRHDEQLSKIDLKVLAVSVDKLAEDDASNPTAARAFIERQKPEFEAGFATDDLVGKLDAAFYYLFDYRRPWAVPTSLLLDKHGRLAFIYIGQVDVEQLEADVKLLSLDDAAWLDASMPFKGRWTSEGRHPNLAKLINTYHDRGFADDALEYVDRFAEVLVADPEASALLLRSATSLGEAGHVVKAKKLFAQAIQADPKNSAAHFQFGSFLTKQRQFADAIRHCREAVRLRPDDADAHFFLANLLKSQDDKEGAQQHFQRTVELQPNSARALFELGTSYAGKLDWNQASNYLRRATELDPEVATFHYQLARVLQKMGQLPESISSFERALEITPDSSEVHYSLGAALAAFGKTDEATKHLREAYRLQPESLLVVNGLAWILATEENPTAADRADAVQLAEKAADLTKHSHPQILDTLSAAYANAGDFDKAVTTARRAVELAKSGRSAELAKEIQGRLNLYRQHKPYRAADHD